MVRRADNPKKMIYRISLICIEMVLHNFLLIEFADLICQYLQNRIFFEWLFLKIEIMQTSLRNDCGGQIHTSIELYI